MTQRSITHYVQTALALDSLSSQNKWNTEVQAGHIGPVTFFAKNTDQPFSILCLRPYGFATGSRTDIRDFGVHVCIMPFFPASGRTAPRSRFRVRYPEPWFPSAILVLVPFGKKTLVSHGTSPNPSTSASPNGVQLTWKPLGVYSVYTFRRILSFIPGSQSDVVAAWIWWGGDDSWHMRSH